MLLMLLYPLKFSLDVDVRHLPLLLDDASITIFTRCVIGYYCRLFVFC